MLYYYINIFILYYNYFKVKLLLSFGVPIMYNWDTIKIKIYNRMAINNVLCAC